MYKIVVKSVLSHSKWYISYLSFVYFQKQSIVCIALIYQIPPIKYSVYSFYSSPITLTIQLTSNLNWVWQLMKMVQSVIQTLWKENAPILKNVWMEVKKNVKGIQSRREILKLSQRGLIFQSMIFFLLSHVLYKTILCLI